ncbi:unnamed protein product [Trichogramma brassicae]|uniref:Uncharacterized protein n=1 Tax=Trichogramma brassicae TaxID=86971 RepID=A0A6H5IXV2_9HYME|nr:unnamed protein product [Trichogramma brassicae]
MPPSYDDDDDDDYDDDCDDCEALSMYKKLPTAPIIHIYLFLTRSICSSAPREHICVYVYTRTILHVQLYYGRETGRAWRGTDTRAASVSGKLFRCRSCCLTLTIAARVCRARLAFSTAPASPCALLHSCIYDGTMFPAIHTSSNDQLFFCLLLIRV